MFENCQTLDTALQYDGKFKDPSTVEILEIAENALIEGYSKNTIAKLLHDELDFKYVNAQALASKAWKNLMATGTKRGEGLKEKNIVRLEHIYKRALADNDYKNALSALDQLNKLTQQYKEKIEISTDEYVIDLLGNGEKEEN